MIGIQTRDNLASGAHKRVYDYSNLPREGLRKSVLMF